MTPGFNTVKLNEEYEKYILAVKEKKESAKAEFDQLLKSIANKITNIEDSSKDVYLNKLCDICSAIVISPTVKRPMWVRLTDLLNDQQSDKIGFERIAYSKIDVTSLMRKLNLLSSVSVPKNVNTYLTAGNAQNKIFLKPVTIYTRDDLSQTLIRKLINRPIGTYGLKLEVIIKYNQTVNDPIIGLCLDKIIVTLYNKRTTCSYTGYGDDLLSAVLNSMVQFQTLSNQKFK